MPLTLAPMKVSLTSFRGSGLLGSINLDAIASVPFTAPPPEGYVWIAGDVTIRVLAATPTGATTDVPGTITAAGVVNEVTLGAFADAVSAAEAIDPAVVQVTVIGAEAEAIEASSPSAILLEAGDFALLETGDKILLEVA